MNQDIIQYIASEFLYFDDSNHLIQCNKHFHVKPYQYNFENNFDSHFNNLKKHQSIKFYFDCFDLSPKEKYDFENIKVKQLILNDNLTKDLNHYVKNLEKSTIEHTIITTHYDQTLPKNLPNSLIKIDFLIFSRYNLPLPATLPSSLIQINFGEPYNQKLPEILPNSLKKIIFGQCYDQPLPEKLPKCLELLVFYKEHKKKILGNNYSIENNILFKNNKNLNIEICELIFLD